MAVDIKGAFAVLGSVYSLSAKSVKRHFSVLVPILLIGLCEAFILVIFYMSPRRPFVSLLGGPITTMMAGGHGDQFLHYPHNFLVLEKLVRFGYIAMMVVIGHVLLGVASRMYANAYENRPPALGGSLLQGLRFWLSTVVAWSLPFAANWGVLKGLTALGRSMFADTMQVAGMGPEVWQGVFKTLYVVLSVVIDVVVLYTIPSIVAEGKRVWPAFVRSFMVMRSAKLISLCIVLVPTVLQLLYIWVAARLRSAYSDDFPDIVVHIAALAILVRFLSEVLLRLPATTTLLLVRDSEEAA